MKYMVSHKVLVACGLFGVVFLIVGTLISYKFIPDIIETRIWEKKVLNNNTEQMDMFMRMPFPFYFKVFFFNIENPEEILNGAKPVLKEIGPYVYKLYRWKQNVLWNVTNNEDISYNEFERYEFDRASSGSHSEDDIVNIINTPLNSFLMTAEDLSPDALPTINDALPGIFGENSGIFLKTKVKDYLFDGIKLCEGGGVKGGFAIKMICSQIIGKLNTTKAMRLFEKSVWFANLRHKNNTSQGRPTIESGNLVREKAGEMVFYNNKKFISVWPGEKSMCNKIRGKTTVFPTNLKPTMTFDAFNDDICRVMTMKYKGQDAVKGINGFKYVTLNDSFWALKNTSNHCFCLNTSKTLDGSVGCLGDGIMDLSTCTGGPILLSFPHLLFADKKYLDTIDGLNPDENLHETFVILEPNSGTPMKLAKRVQFNMFLRPIDDITMLDNVTHSIIPIMWVEESYTLGDKYIDQVKESLLKVLNFLGIIRWVILIVGGISIIVPFFCLIYME